MQFSGQTTTHFFIFFPSIFSQKWNFKKFSISQKGGVFPHEHTHTVENPMAHQMTLDYFYGQSGELFSYFRIPKALFQDSRFRQLSTDARTLYGILLDRMSLSVKNGWMDKQGRVYIIYTVREVQESLCCAEHKAIKLFRELEQIDLIERKRRGLG